MARGTIFKELDPLFHPRSVALIGASAKPGKIGRLFLESFIEMGFPRLYPVNPGESEILGLPAYRSVLLIPHPVDMAVVVTPPVSAPAAVRECVAKGVKAIVINTSGFAETGEKGREAQEEMAAAARAGGARIIGPNCIGLYCPASKLPFLLGRGREAGSVGLVSQSGFFADYLTETACANGVRFSKAVSCGNESDLTATDFLRYLGEDPETDTIVAYMEGVRDGRLFYDAAREISKEKPIILLRAGLTEGGARAAVSHTGVLAGSRPVWEGVVRHTGIVSARSFEEVSDLLYAFCLQPLPKGPRVGIVSGPGGIAVATTDICLRMGLAVPPFSPAASERLKEAMPTVGGSIGNPVDLSLASLLGPHVFRDAVRILSEEESIDMILVIAVVGGDTLRRLIEEATSGLSSKKPIAVVVMAGTVDAVGRDCRMLLQAGISAYTDSARAAYALSALWKYARTRDRIRMTGRRRPAGKGLAASLAARRIIRRAAGEARSLLSGHESMGLLAAYGVPVANGREVLGEAELKEVLSGMGFPVAIKAGGPASHKTERGQVHLDVRSEEEAISAFRSLVPGKRMVPVLVQEMIDGERELIVGLVRDPHFGPCVMVGSGGVFSEVLKDDTFRAAPVERQEALEMIDELKMRPALGPFRGMPAADLGRIADIIVAVGRAGVDHPEIEEIDINPVMISGGRPVAVDALIHLRG